jgi:hypothetical protein
MKKPKNLTHEQSIDWDRMAAAIQAIEEAEDCRSPTAPHCAAVQGGGGTECQE